MVIHDLKTLKDIMTVTVSILRNNFFYDEELIERFMDDYMNQVLDELSYFLNHADEDMIDDLKTDHMARVHFTCYFASVNLRHVFIDKMHFTDQELIAFENILPKYVGAKPYEAKSRHTRKNY